MKNTRNKVRLTESQLHQVIKKSVSKVLKESSDSVATQPFGRDEDMMYGGDNNDSFFRKHHPWRNNPDCSTLEGLIEWGYVSAREFEEGKLSIRNYLADLYRMA